VIGAGPIAGAIMVRPILGPWLLVASVVVVLLMALAVWQRPGRGRVVIAVLVVVAVAGSTRGTGSLIAR